MADANKHLSPIKKALLKINDLQKRVRELESIQNEPVAIVGIGCRFPGEVDSPAACWELLADAINTAGYVPLDRWNNDDYFMPYPGAAGHLYTQKASFIEGIDQFDPAFFGISGREAEAMDPQQRLMLEVAWWALEDAAIDPHSLRGSRCGVFMGVMNQDYADMVTGPGTSACVMAGRLSYVLGLHGPSLSLDTACSSSLVALHLAVKSIQCKETNLSLVGGVNLQVTPKMTIAECEGNMLSPDGICKTFSEDADGYGRGDGCGVVVLKPLSAALNDGNRIYAVIKGSAVNHDGAAGGLTVPNGPAQEKVIRAALKDANVQSSDVSYVETHGTGTPLGDPIELNALQQVYGEGRAASETITLGAVKTNFGHLEAAAGIASIIKAALCLYHKKIPANLNYSKPNANFDWRQSVLKVPEVLQDWRCTDKPRLAGVSSFGVSGTNAHIIMSESTEMNNLGTKNDSEHNITICKFSALNGDALFSLLRKQLEYFKRNSNLKLKDIARTLNLGRADFPARAVFRVSSKQELIERISQVVQDNGSSRVDGCHVHYTDTQTDTPQLIFLFTGQGSQYPGMGKQLYESEPVFRDCIDRCADILDKFMDVRLTSLLWGTDQDRLSNTRYTQPALFSLEYSLASYWQSLGQIPDAVMGHSVGEYAAACFAGFFSLEDGLYLISERGRLMAERCDTGGMLAVFASQEDCQSIGLGKKLSIAALNGQSNTVVSGDNEALENFSRLLDRHKIAYQLLNVSHAFHSHMMEPMLDEFRQVAEKVTYLQPNLTLVSNLSGNFAGDEIQHADYWVNHVKLPVQYWKSIQSVLSDNSPSCFIEIGPGKTLLAMAKRCVARTDISWLPSLSSGSSNTRYTDIEQIYDSVSELYISGRSIDWSSLTDKAADIVSLAGYSFQRQRYWLGQRKIYGLDKVVSSDAGQTLLKNQYHLSWEALSLPQAEVGLNHDAHEHCLVITETVRDSDKLNDYLCKQFSSVEFISANESNLKTFKKYIERFELSKISRLIIILLPDTHATIDESVSFQRCMDFSELIARLVKCCLTIQDVKVKLHLLSNTTDIVHGLFKSVFRSAALEHPDMFGQNIDFDRSIDVCDENDLNQCRSILSNDDLETHLRVKNGVIYTARLSAIEQTSNLSSCRILNNASYLITGGFGGVGLAYAKALTNTGAKHIVLIGRRGRTAGDERCERILNELEGQGVCIESIAADITDSKAVEKIMLRFGEDLPELKGIVHAAGVDDYALITDLDKAAWKKMLSPKVIGACLLHQHSLNHALDIFIAVSSISSVWGAQGNSHYAGANGFLDALCDYRKELGLASCAVNFGPLSGSGFSNESRESYLLQSGLKSLPLVNAVATSLSLCSSREVILVDADWQRLRELFCYKRPTRLFDNLIPVDNSKSDLNNGSYEWPEALKTLNQREQNKYILQSVESIVRTILKISQDVKILHNAPIQSLGVDSLTALEIKDAINKASGLDMPSTLVFDYPSVKLIAEEVTQALMGRHETVQISKARVEQDDIAIVGMGCRFPGGSNSLNEFWQLLLSGTDAIEDKPLRWDLDRYFSQDPNEQGKAYTLSAGLIDEVDCFAASFFDISAREAIAMDPQQRLALEVSWQAFQDAGISPFDENIRNTGVFIGVGTNEYGQLLSADPDVQKHFGHMPTGNAVNAIAGRISYQFGFDGPSMAVDTACSSALVAIHQAAQSIRSGECRAALAGGVDLLLTAENFVMLCKAEMLSPQGRCKVFDESADGYVRGEGCGMLLLKPYREAVKDADHIYAVIKGSAVNQDGRSSSLTAPNGLSQQAVLKSALASSGVRASDVAYIEAHGTGTALGDPIEMHAIDAVFADAQQSDNNVLTVGSVKSNIGHLEAAAGIAGVIKTVLSLYNREIPASLHHKKLNSHIRISSSIKVADQRQPWPETRYIAGVSSFGFSGTNAHIILSAAPKQPECPQQTMQATYPKQFMYAFSAKNSEMLETMKKIHADFITGFGENTDKLLSACYTSQYGRTDLPYKCVAIGDSAESLAEAILSNASDNFYEKYNHNPLTEWSLMVSDDWLIDANAFQDLLLYSQTCKYFVNNFRDVLPLLQQETDVYSAELIDYLKAHGNERNSQLVMMSTYLNFIFSIAEMPVNIIASSNMLPAVLLALNYIGWEDTLRLVEFDKRKKPWNIKLSANSIDVASKINSFRLTPASLSNKEFWAMTNEKDKNVFEVTLSNRQSSWIALPAKLLCEGINIDWPQFYSGLSLTRMSLPICQLPKERYWPNSKSHSLFAGSEEKSVWPEQILNLPFSNEIRYQTVINRHQPAHLVDHCIFDNILVAGATQIAAVLNVVSDSLKAPAVELKAIVFEEALSPQNDYHFQVCLQPDSNNGYFFRNVSIEIGKQDSQWKTHLSGTFSILNNESMPDLPDKLSITQTWPIAGSADLLYQDMDELGYNLGDSFRWLEDGWREGNAVLRRMHWPSLPENYSKYRLYPGLIDSCFHTIGNCMDTINKQVDADHIYIPFSVKYFRFYRTPKFGAQLWCYAKLQSGIENTLSERAIGDALLFDEFGVLLEVIGFESRKASRALLNSGVPTRAYDWDWVRYKLPLSNEARNEYSELKNHSWDLIGAKSEMGFYNQFFALLGEHVNYIDLEEVDLSDVSHNDSVVFFLPDSNLLHCEYRECFDIVIQFLSFLTKKIQTGALKYCYLVAKGAESFDQPIVNPLHSAIWGMLISIRHEHPNIHFQLVDMPVGSSEASLGNRLAECLLIKAEDALLVRNDGLFTKRIKNASLGFSLESSFSSDSCCLITGGAGALGQHLVSHLLQRGVKFIALLGRTERKLSEDLLKMAGQLNADIRFYKVDISDYGQLQNTLQKINRDMPSLTDVFHLAGVYKDGLLLNQTVDNFSKVFDAKAAGAWNLHQLTARLALKRFVAFSSVASWLGIPGQSNYAAANAFVDGLMSWRRSQGLPGVSINWGPWGHIGHASLQEDEHQQYAQRQGVHMLDPEIAMQWFDAVIKDADNNIAVLAMDWENYRGNVNASIASSLEYLVDQVGETVKTRTQELAESLILLVSEATEQDTLLKAEQYCKMLIASVLRIDVEDIDMQLGLNAMGFDSLLIIELRRRIASELGVDVEMAVLMGTDSVSDFAGLINELIQQHNKYISINSPDYESEELVEVEL